MAVYVPNTTTFSLTAVKSAVEDHAGPITGTLQHCFNLADNDYFDGEYNDDAYAPANSMLRFRNYGPLEDDISGKYILVPDGFSPNDDGVHDYFEIFNLEYYPRHKVVILAMGAFLLLDGGGAVPQGRILYERKNDYHNYPWDGKYNGYRCPESGSLYGCVLEINGKQHTRKFIIIAR